MDIRKIRPEDADNINEKLIFDMPETETLSLGYVRLKKGEQNNLASHPDEEEIYIILSGEAHILIGNEYDNVKAGDTVYIPRDTDHQMTCVSDEDLEYLYLANYPDTYKCAEEK